MAGEFLEVPIRSNKLFYTVQVTRTVHSRTTEFQKIDIVESEAFGKMLLLDGHIQLTELDEHAYHESLVHIPLIGTGPRTALVIGGGDGGVIRELCRYPSIERVDMAEIDQGVIDACREHLPSVSGNAFDDPRVRVHVTDAFRFVKESTSKYDLIVADSTDTYEDEEGALSESLFTREFYNDCRGILSPEGVMVTQADNLIFCPYSTENARDAFAQVFGKVGIYQAVVPSFGGFSGYCWGSEGREVGIAEWREPPFPCRYLSQATYAMAFQNLGFSR